MERNAYSDLKVVKPLHKELEQALSPSSCGSVFISEDLVGLKSMPTTQSLPALSPSNSLASLSTCGLGSYEAMCN